MVATSGEILGEDEDNAFERDSATDDTRLRTAVAWLEEAVLLTREENRVQVFPSSLRVGSLGEAQAKLQQRNVPFEYRRQLLKICETLIEADADEGISTDELMAASGLTSEGVRKALHDLEEVGIASDDTALTAFVHAGVERSSLRRFQQPPTWRRRSSTCCGRRPRIWDGAIRRRCICASPPNGSKTKATTTPCRND